MTRFRLLLLNEFKLARTTLPIHLVAIIQPSLIYLLMSLILVHPTFDLRVSQPTTDKGRALVAAMREVGSPIGAPYINPIMVSDEETAQVKDPALRQIITIESHDGVPVAVQRFGLIDSNTVKNLRNRLTAAALRLWEDSLGDSAVTIQERPWLPYDVPYMVYFGIAMLPMTAFMAAIFIGGILTTQDFEFQTITEYRLAPIVPTLVWGTRLVRLVLSGLLSAGVLLLTVGLRAGYWPDSIWRVGLTVLPMATIAGGSGIAVGLLLRRSIPTLLVGLLSSLGCWILGGAFGLVAGFGGLYEQISRLMPHTYAVELLFPRYYGTPIGDSRISACVLLLFSLGALALTSLAYRRRVLRRE